MPSLSQQFEKTPPPPISPEQIKQPEKKSEMSSTEFIELAGSLVGKMKSEAQALFNDNNKKGAESVKALGGGDNEAAELAKLEEPVKIDIEKLVRTMALKLQKVVGVDSQTIEVPQQDKDLAKDTESKLKKFLKNELKLVTLTPAGMPFRPLVRLITEKDYRDYVLKKAPELAPVLAKAIATEGASLTNPADIKVLVDFAINDPKSPAWLKNWANKLLASKEGEALISKASSKLIAKKEKSI